MSDLPVDIDATYPDRDAGDAAHQQHHDALHDLYNELKGSDTAEGVATLRALLDGTYPPIAATDRIEVSPVPWVITNGSPASGIATGSAAPYLALDAAAIELVVGIVNIPAYWVTCDIKFRWTNAGAGSGDVVFQAAFDGKAPGESLNASAGTTIADPATAGVQWLLMETTVVAGAAVPTDGDTTYLRIGRRGTEAGDTLGNDVGLLSVILERAS